MVFLAATAEQDHIEVASSGLVGDSWRLERRQQGTSKWYVVAKDLPGGYVYRDFNTASGVTYHYRGRESSYALSDELSASVELDAVYIHDVLDPEGVHRFFHDGGGRTHDSSLHREITNHVETPLPSVSFSPTLRHRATFALTVDEDDREAFETFLRLRRPVVYRDKRGTMIHGVLEGTVQSLDGDGWHQVSGTIDRTSWTLETV